VTRETGVHFRYRLENLQVYRDWPKDPDKDQPVAVAAQVLYFEIDFGFDLEDEEQFAMENVNTIYFLAEVTPQTKVVLDEEASPSDWWLHGDVDEKCNVVPELRVQFVRDIHCTYEEDE
jgi:hypothetical protein